MISPILPPSNQPHVRTSKFGRRFVRALLASALQLPVGAFAYTVTVTSDADSGRRTFRAAMEEASLNPQVDRIIFRPTLGTITLKTPVVYSGTQALAFTGRNATLTNAGGEFALLRTTSGATLQLDSLNFEGSGAAGLLVEVPATATGTIDVSLTNCGLRNNRGNGLHFDERADSAGGGADSAASLLLTLQDCQVTGNGIGGADDTDGIRVDEGGEGDLTFHCSGLNATGNAYDGLELDEAGEGDVYAAIDNSTLDKNGFGNPLDLEDGFDIDEAGPGDVNLLIANSKFSCNGEQGIDVNESDSGNFSALSQDVEASKNLHRGAQLEESGDGSQTITLENVSFQSNGNDGLRLDEKDAGDQTLTASGFLSTNNAGDGIQGEEQGTGHINILLGDVEVTENTSDGIKFEEFADGDAAVQVHSGSITGHKTGTSQGFDLDENDGGNFTVTLTDLVIAENASDGVDATERLAGSLTVSVTRCAVSGNVGDDGLQFTEGGEGDLLAAIDQTTSSHGGMDGIQLSEAAGGNLVASVTASAAEFNVQAGIRVTQAGLGTGNLTLNTTALTGNGGGAVVPVGVLVSP